MCSNLFSDDDVNESYIFHFNSPHYFMFPNVTLLSLHLTQANNLKFSVSYTTASFIDLNVQEIIIYIKLFMLLWEQTLHEKAQNLPGSKTNQNT